MLKEDPTHCKVCKRELDGPVLEPLGRDGELVDVTAAGYCTRPCVEAHVKDAYRKMRKAQAH
jgi:hypothetical protein